MESKRMKSFRLSEETIKELESISKREKVSQSTVLAILIHSRYRELDIDTIEEYFEIARRTS
jgi:hypothetical protein